MNRFSRLAGSSLLGIAGLAATAVAGGPSTAGYGHGGHAFAARHLQKCLTAAGVSSEQQTAIDNIQTEAKPNMQAGFAAMKAAQDKLQNDLAAGADKSVLGQDVLDKDAAWNKVKADHKAVHDQIFAQLSQEQQNTVNSCMQEGRRGKGGASLSEEPTQ
jgi:hypothetical protein